MVAAYEVVHSEILVLKKLWSDDEFTQLFANFATDGQESLKCKRVAPSCIQENFLTETSGLRDDDRKLFLKAAYFKVTDTLLSEFQHRFSECNSSLVKSLCAFVLTSDGFLDAKGLKPLCSMNRRCVKYDHMHETRPQCHLVLLGYRQEKRNNMTTSEIIMEFKKLSRKLCVYRI